jgi:hypothetical protein
MNRFDCKGNEILLMVLVEEALILAVHYENHCYREKSNTHNRATTSIADNVSFSSLLIHQLKRPLLGTMLTSRRPL